MNEASKDPGPDEAVDLPCPNCGQQIPSATLKFGTSTRCECGMELRIVLQSQTPEAASARTGTQPKIRDLCGSVLGRFSGAMRFFRHKILPLMVVTGRNTAKSLTMELKRLVRWIQSILDHDLEDREPSPDCRASEMVASDGPVASFASTAERPPLKLRVDEGFKKLLVANSEKRFRDLVHDRLLLSARSTLVHTGRNSHKKVRTLQLDLAPGLSNFVCPNMTPTCAAFCCGGKQGGQGLMRFDAIYDIRAQRTMALHLHRDEFIKQLCEDIRNELRISYLEHQKLIVQLNVFSDIPWERREFGEIPQQFPDVQFWDFTRDTRRVRVAPKNYHLIASWGEDATLRKECAELLHAGYNIAMLFARTNVDYFSDTYEGLPETWDVGGKRFPVHNFDFQNFNLLKDDILKNEFSHTGKILAKCIQAINPDVRRKAIEAGICESWEPA